MLELTIGNKAYSSWSLRPWLLMRVLEVPFREVRIPLYQNDSKAHLLERSRAGKVPVLQDEGLEIWDSLAICEYVAEKEARGWPGDSGARAVARSVSAEMHSSFQHLRNECEMNLRKTYWGYQPSDGVLTEVARVQEIWRDCRERFSRPGAPWLFGDFSIADAMFAPIAMRFVTYGLSIDGEDRTYVDALLALPAMRSWVADANRETEIIEPFEKALECDPFPGR
jgi:glutathione S-transferase